MLTPLDLNGKTFSKSFRGYDTDEVNQFFLQISKEYERLYQDNVELKDSVERVSAKLEYYQRMESTMQSTLVVAQEAADEVKKNSLEKADVLAKETELACSKQKEVAAAFCNKLRADAEAEVTRIKSEADVYADNVRKKADEYAARTRGEADEYGKTTRTDADSYALGLRSKADSSTKKLREETQSFVDKMKSLAEIEVAKMKVVAQDNCKSQLAESREQARTLAAEASAHANQVMADANQQSHNIVSEATRKAYEMIARAQKQSQDMIAEATQKSRQMISEATEQSRTMIHEATERSQKMVFVAETKAAAAIDTYSTMINKANSQSKQFKSLLQSQLSLYENFDADFAVDQMVQAKLQAVKKAEPVLETKAEDLAADTEDVAAKAEDVAAGVDTEVTETENPEEPVRDAAPQDEANTEKEPVVEATEPDRVVAQTVEQKKEEPVVKETINAANKVAESPARPLFSRFKPRNSVIFNRNGFPRKNADLRVALSELQKSVEAESQSNGVKPEPAGEVGNTESQAAEFKPEGNKES